MDVRPARPEDKPHILPFATATFAWGDYVPDAFDRWIQSDHGTVLVAVDEQDLPHALVRANLLSPEEGWLQGIRVAEPHRRRGIARLLTESAIDWCREQGADVVRLYTDSDNQPSRATVESMEFRPGSHWSVASRSIGAASPMPSGNGGRRVPATEQLARAHSSEAEPAFMSWESGELSRAARGLFAIGWTWRRLLVDDLAGAAKTESLWEARSGWALASRRDDVFSVGWVETGSDDAYDFCRALVDLAATSGAERLQAMLPATPWLVHAARRAGCQVRPGIVYARGT